MPSRSRPQGALAASPAERAVISTGEKPAHFYQKEDNLEGLQKEPTVLGFAITGVLSIISGKKSSKPFALSSLVSNALSALAAGVGLFFLGHSLGAVGALSRQCDSEKEHLPSLPYASYYHSIAEVKNCLLAGVSLTGMLVVMLAFTVLELLLATYASVFWWKQVYSSHPGVYFLRLSHKIIPSMSKRALQGQGYE
ncbi:PREDICTED: membrane-spanning 4-domains subfamily A member 7 isoform X2 [Condylura cristata]|uniref:membrane-spanning 4-domains subfamily A member 7 isoform X2 n=1 Tax=Condylura cristata TaxID=143302 RepID=UPI000642C94B|nr:PREDICTED: membrane-spanning 4-domains subfamily A member 7 isoform X2 [Condylura cristata]